MDASQGQPTINTAYVPLKGPPADAEGSLLLFQLSPSPMDNLSVLPSGNLNAGVLTADDDGTRSDVDDTASDVGDVPSDVPGVSPDAAGNTRADGALGDDDDDDDARDSILCWMLSLSCDDIDPRSSSCVPMTHNKTAFNCSKLIAPTPSRS